jgi:RHS repeat-associated protein
LSATIAYDSAGNLLNDTFHTYQWDPYGHSTIIGPPAGLGSCGSTGTTCVTYDASGRTVETQTGMAYSQILYSPQGKTAIMNGQVTQNQYAALPGGATAYLTGSTGTIRYFWHKDWLGTARFASGIVSRTLYYDRAFAPFGEMYDNFGNSSGLDFTGDTQDTVSGTYDTPNREQNPSQGRWISPDPAGLSAADFNHPQTLNRYSYVANYPLTMTDPTGMDPGYDTWDPGLGSSHSGPGSLLDAFVAAVEAVRDGTSLPWAGERYDTTEWSPYENQGGNQSFTTWSASAAFVEAQDQSQTQQKQLSVEDVSKAIQSAKEDKGPNAKIAVDFLNSLGKNWQLSGDTLRDALKANKVNAHGEDKKVDSISRKGDKVTVQLSETFTILKIFRISKTVTFDVGAVDKRPALVNIQGVGELQRSGIWFKYEPKTQYGPD